MPRRARYASSTLIAIAVLLGAARAEAQAWASKMFDKLDHDFGVVARGSDTVYKFEIKNIFKEDVEIGSVRSSCGCTTPSIENKLLKTYEKGYIVARFNTRTFTGVHSATLTVNIVKPYAAQVQLRVHGNIRGDVVFEPGSVDFETLDQGETAERTLQIAHAGRSSWEVTDVRSVSDHLEAELIERQRRSGKVTYELVVRLLPSAPPGFLKEQLVIVTNDRSNPRVPLEIAGKITPEVSVAPDNLVLGDVPRGDTVTKRLLVRGKKPFRVTGVECEDDCFTFETKEEEGLRHIVTVTFTADRTPGRFREPITILTDLGGSYSAVCQAYATVTDEAPKDGVAAESGDAKTVAR